QQAPRLAHSEPRAAELADRRGLHSAAQLERHHLHPVADAHHRDPELQELGREARRAVGVHRGGAAREDQPARGAAPDLLERDGVRQELAEDAALADPPRYELRVLAPEVENENFLGARCARHVVRRLLTWLAEGPAHATGAPTGPPPLSAAP